MKLVELLSYKVELRKLENTRCSMMAGSWFAVRGWLYSRELGAVSVEIRGTADGMEESAMHLLGQRTGV